MTEGYTAGRSRVLVGCSTKQSTDWKSRSSKVKDREKAAQSARLVNHFGGLDTVGVGAVMSKFTG
jgi:hypothetical protein